jgi:hypothetical protein
MPEGPAFFQAIQRLTTVNWGATKASEGEPKLGFEMLI